MAKNYWLVKSEPESYSWKQFQSDGRTAWTGVRNFLARNHLRAMKRGDLVLFYHSVSEKQIVGIAVVDREAYPDATAEAGDWSCVDLKPSKTLKLPVTLEQLKSDDATSQMAFIRQSRLSVSPLVESEFQRVLRLAGMDSKT
jgi:predicted RNA-binding protein with PUA-like domain